MRFAWPCERSMLPGDDLDLDRHADAVLHPFGQFLTDPPGRIVVERKIAARPARSSVPRGTRPANAEPS